MPAFGPPRIRDHALPSHSLESEKEGDLTPDRLAELLAALAEAVEDSDTLLLVDRSPPGETRSPSITVGAGKGEEEPRLSVTFETDSEQAVFQGVYWRSGQFTPAMRERHGLLFPPAVFRVEDDAYGISDPRHRVRQGDGEKVERYGAAREAAGFLLDLLEHFYAEVQKRSE